MGMFSTECAQCGSKEHSTDSCPHGIFSKCAQCGSKEHSTDSCPHGIFSKCAQCGSKEHSTDSCPHLGSGEEEESVDETEGTGSGSGGSHNGSNSSSGETGWSAASQQTARKSGASIAKFVTIVVVGVVAVLVGVSMLDGSADRSSVVPRQVTLPHGEWLVSDDRVGPLRIGAKVSEVAVRVGTSLIRQRDENSSCDWWVLRDGSVPGVAFLTADDRLVIANVWGKHPTLAGVRVGDLETKLKNAYTRNLHKFEPIHANATYAITYVPQERSQEGNRIVFRMLRQKVLDYYVGDFSKLSTACPELAALLGPATVPLPTRSPLAAQKIAVDHRLPYVNLREGAGESFAVLGQIPAGSIVSIVDSSLSDGRWIKLEWNGLVGYAIRSRTEPVASGS